VSVAGDIEKGKFYASNGPTQRA